MVVTFQGVEVRIEALNPAEAHRFLCDALDGIRALQAADGATPSVTFRTATYRVGRGKPRPTDDLRKQ